MRDICCDIHEDLTCEEFTSLPEWCKDVYAYVADPGIALQIYQ